MRATRGRILVIRGGAIGDFILTLPAIAALRNQFPEAHLEVLGYPHIAQLALAGGVVDRVQPIEARGLAGFFAARGTLDEAMTDYFARFDIVVSYLFDPDLFFQTNVALCTKARFIQCPHRPDEAERIHATQVYLKPLESLAIFAADPVPRLVVGQASRLSDGASLNIGMVSLQSVPPPDRRDARPTTIALHPGSGSEKKNWPEQNWAALVQRLVTDTSMKLLIVGGEAEGGKLDRLARQLPPERVEVARSLPLWELAVRLHSCAAFIGHDSGISHLAAAVGLPTLVLWGHTMEEIWCPQGEQVVIVRAEGGLGALTVEQLKQELAEAVPGLMI